MSYKKNYEVIKTRVRNVYVAMKLRVIAFIIAPIKMFVVIIALILRHGKDAIDHPKILVRIANGHGDAGCWPDAERRSDADRGGDGFP